MQPEAEGTTLASVQAKFQQTTSLSVLVGNAVTNGSCLHVQDLTQQALYAYVQLTLNAVSCFYTTSCASVAVQ